ncbi:2-(1,2-epoxy-1,2-dihydrophenyl)acetyl-CoA isomerase [Mycolicibacterium sp. BK556]|uniref:enoyl-CoA hydratase/isomerase family protein n=1 Tax=unclassified Mycolicibacterium TaxID=2636767 RepID=UPI001614FEFA|nr:MULTISPECIES: enoyl-CoA hydratase/isomerase family protein [unclassified Mycolicibacterium]MBB3606118.1 2-(1,2-epoxy-1,2-dihydrophenyl)acetyl-CoA isomerase [Mycolicibacterium sp. BK556]MBB3632695.1 2-(1,2-epoxy-1,2-dihydrophenyl)acetyl-CoA isomerase [Mycolicibacterium sp. BK607]MBB3754044.1 2-(1,2-epoxy-1,2-dihydrophenyl)acetyl-CoA isomerase [Mycolicibacterium sp. BK634]
MSVTTSLDGHVGWITLDRPDRMNAITVGLASALRDAIESLGADPAVNVIVIRGSGGNFCAGGDFEEVERLRAEGPAALTELFATFRQACDAIAGVEIPVVVAVEGSAAAGGFELMQAADIVLVSETAKIADNHVKFGMVPGGGGTARLPRLLGRQQALGVLLSGDRLSGLDAVRLGLAYRAFPQDEFDDGITRFVTQLAERRRDAVITIKRLVAVGIDEGLRNGLDAEMDAVVRHIVGDAGSDSVTAFQSREVRA